MLYLIYFYIIYHNIKYFKIFLAGISSNMRKNIVLTDSTSYETQTIVIPIITLHKSIKKIFCIKICTRES